MSEAGDYVPAPHWQGTIDNFQSARAQYVDHRNRSYDEAVQANIGVDDCVPNSLTTESEAPLVIACDVTGSMGEWPGVIFSKLPYLEYEGQEYLGDGMEISFCAFGDGPGGDIYALQVRPFSKGKEMKTQLEKLIPKQNGFGNMVESPDLAAIYYAEKCEMPEAIRKPIFIFITDEGIYGSIHSDCAKKWTRVDNSKLTVESVFKKLKDKFNVYCVRKPYSSSYGDDMSDTDKPIHKQWCELLGAENVVILPAAERVVDVIFGILAKETGRIDYFEKELKDRQGKDSDGAQKIAVVMKSLVTMHNLAKDPSLKKLEGPKGAKSKSVTPSKSAGPKGGNVKSKSLLDDDDC
jgi:hypothetical protein